MSNLETNNPTIQLYYRASLNPFEGQYFEKFLIAWYHNLYGKLICCKSLKVKLGLAQRKTRVWVDGARVQADYDQTQCGI